MYILYLIPKNILSRLVGWLMHLRLGSLPILIFAKIYNINLIESEKPYTEYKSIGDFFIRKLKSNARPLSDSQYLHPADSLISQIGKIENSTLIQAKGKTYSLHEFLQNSIFDFEQGLFITYYLCPTDYHRVHSPITGKITSVIHIPGNLWPVNDWSVENIQNLFCVNERVIVNFETEQGPVSLVFVGATNVGKITLSFEEKIVSNCGQNKINKIQYSNPIAIQKGQELGVFHMGSTVVMCYSKSVREKVSDGRILSLMQKKVNFGDSLI